jgi:hypothetical protein
VTVTSIRLTVLVLLASVAQTWSSAPRYERPQSYCALALPPSQVVSTPRLEAVYCYGIEDGDCRTTIGWVVVSKPVRCD